MKCERGSHYANQVLSTRPDLVLIDGRNRKLCAEAVLKCRPDIVIWDDAERTYYQCVLGLFDIDYKHRDFVCDVAAPKMARLFVRKGGRFEAWI